MLRIEHAGDGGPSIVGLTLAVNLEGRVWATCVPSPHNPTPAPTDGSLFSSLSGNFGMSHALAMFLWRNKGDIVWSIAPLDSSPDQLEVLQPHLLQDRDQRAFPHSCGCLWSLHRLQQHPAILTHLLQQLHLCPLALGKPLQLKTIYVEIKPVRGDHTQQPLAILLSQLI